MAISPLTKKGSPETLRSDDHDLSLGHPQSCGGLTVARGGPYHEFVDLDRAGWTLDNGMIGSKSER
jgi:hypothetical protein